MSKEHANEGVSKKSPVSKTKTGGSTKKGPFDTEKTKINKPEAKKSKVCNVGFNGENREHQRGSSLNSENRVESEADKENQNKSKRGRSQSASSVFHNSGKITCFQMLSYENIQCLEEVLKTPLQFSARLSTWPPLQMTLRELITSIKNGLEHEEIHVKDVRLGGAGAAYVFVDKSVSHDVFNSVELIFTIDCSGVPALNIIRSAVLQTLSEFAPDYEGVRNFITGPVIKEAYVHRMVRVNNTSQDCWSLLSLGNPLVENEKIIDLKFVSRMKRKFEFTVDSFQIVVDSMLSFLDKSSQPLSEHFYPPVVSECTAGDFEEALHHLNNRLIATRNPEEIRGGGLLKYCNLLVEGYKAVDMRQMSSVERYMCSRFFIDFPDSTSQLKKLESHLTYHYGLDEAQQVLFLRTLRRIVDKSTVCLTQQERRRTLRLIDSIIQSVTNKEAFTGHSSVIELKEFDNQNWTLDQVFYGTSYFPQEFYVQCTVPTAFHGPTIVSANHVELENASSSENTSTPSTTMDSQTQCASSYKFHVLDSSPVLVQSQS